MKNSVFTLLLSLVLASCSTANKMASQSIRNAIIGQNEMIVLERLGTPTRVEHARDGGKVIIYESTSKGMFLTPYTKPTISYNTTRDHTGEMQGLTYTSNVNTAVNDPKYTIYPTNISCLRVYIDKHGKAINIEQNLPREQLELYHDRFKHFSPYQR